MHPHPAMSPAGLALAQEEKEVKGGRRNQEAEIWGSPWAAPADKQKSVQAARWQALFPLSQARRRFSRPHMMAERSGVSGNFCTFTSFTETEGKPESKLLQPSGRPQGRGCRPASPGCPGPGAARSPACRDHGRDPDPAPGNHAWHPTRKRWSRPVPRSGDPDGPVWKASPFWRRPFSLSRMIGSRFCLNGLGPLTHSRPSPGGVAVLC